MSPLLDPLQLGPVRLPNRIVMAPLTRMRCFQGRAPGELQATHYAQRADAGLILTEATSVSPMGVGYPNTPGIWTEEQVIGWKRVVDAVHAQGGRICIQLWHVGRISDPELLEGALPVAPSAIAPAGDVKVLRPKRPYSVPRPLETAEIAEVVRDFARAAANAKAAGFDFVEVHAANGYLFDQFMHDGSNQRTDQYGGPVENRARLLMEVLDAMAQVWPSERIGVHLNLMSSSHDMHDSNPKALFTHVAQQLQARQIGFLFAREALVGEGAAAVLPMGQHVRPVYRGTYIANEGFTRETGERVLERGWADAVAYGRDYMANPDLVTRFARGAALNVLNDRTVYSADGTGYNDYPVLDATSA
ncbi:alkene reductase [Comamonas serinivorans]|uniref:Alkene reductase n=1 Tax=Comamonas serinivorans TaxID=1082851 RepID=A0A1Y0EMK2_9BURK|nr:alkene reductase [Comamonas serinivorans]ARU04826.1 alkene reductase [Comamonas serinivorans]